MEKPGTSQEQPASELISKRIAELADWRGETLGRMRRLIQEADPDVIERLRGENRLADVVEFLIKTVGAERCMFGAECPGVGSQMHLIGEKAMQGPPDLAIEVLSPSSITTDRKDKFKLYAAGKVKYYWIVDPKQRTIEA